MTTKSNPFSPHILSFDVEEYFQVEAARSCVRSEEWSGFQKRLDAVTDELLSLLAEYSTRATFFVLGWVAREERALVERIARAGHEIASHGMTHRMLTMLTPEEFHAELRESRKLLEDITGRPITGYRAPTFSIVQSTAWAIDVLAEEGFAYDSSIFPVHHDRYGVPNAPRNMYHAVGPDGGRMLEIPPLTWRCAGRNLPAAGGGYLRLFPVHLIGAALRQAQRTSQPGMIYLHPWELDADQPVLAMGRLTCWRHRVNLNRTAGKLRWLLRRFRFAAAEDVLADVDTDVLTGYRLADGRGGDSGSR